MVEYWDSSREKQVEHTALARTVVIIRCRPRRDEGEKNRGDLAQPGAKRHSPVEHKVDVELRRRND